MKIVTYVSDMRDLQVCAWSPYVKEVLLEPELTSQLGRLEREKAESLAKEAARLGLRPVLVWDILMPENVFQHLCRQLQRQWDLGLYAAIRVQDLGAAQFLFDALPDTRLQLIVENNNHNLEALLGWCERFGERLDKLILSLQLPEEKLVRYCRELPVSCEILAAGRILIFYSPRKLLSLAMAQQTRCDENLCLEALCSSVESGDRLFPVIQNRHGTFMFLDQDQFILDRLSRLEEVGFDSIRIDLREFSRPGRAAEGIEIFSAALTGAALGLREKWPRPTGAPFFRANQSAAQFSELKKHRYAALGS